MSPRLPSPWRVASVVVMLGLLGSAIVTLALVDSPARPAAGERPGPAGLPIPTLGGGQSTGVSAGLRLLRRAAAACQSVSYRGVQTVAWIDDSGITTADVEVWHQPGRGILAQAAGTLTGPLAELPAGPSAQPVSGPGPAGLEPVLGVSGHLLVLMQANYDVVYAGHGSADNRPARVVEVRRRSGALAARFWLDAATSLPLRRELFDANARVVSEDAFVNLTIGADSLASMPAAAASPWSAKLGATGLGALRAQGWPLPDKLPGNLVLFAADRSSARSGAVIDLSYSDGLSVLSLFVQRGVLPATLPGWRLVSVRGHAVYTADPGERSLVWSAGGYEFTLIADAPSATVSQAVAALPRDGEPRFWQRLGRGFRRLLSWANPFR